MRKRYIPLSDGRSIYEGSIVVFGSYQDTKWIAHYGWYKYNTQQYNGWYFSSIPDQMIMPLSNTLLEDVSVLSDDCPYPHPPTPRPPGPPCPPHPDFNHDMSKTFITVDTIPERDLLNKTLLPHGKIVKVNFTPEGYTQYYSWDQINSKWVTETFGIDSSAFVTEESVDQKLEPISTTLSEIKTKMEEIDSKATWKQLN